MARDLQPELDAGGPKGSFSSPGEPFVFSLATVGQAMSAVRAYRWPRELRRMDESLRGWRLHYERCLNLLQETRESGDDWPLQRYPDGWSRRVDEALADLRRALEDGFDCHFPERSNSNLRVLADTLRQAADRPETLSGRQVGLVRRILLDSEKRWGTPGSAQRSAALRQRHSEGDREALRQALLERLGGLNPDGAIEELDEILGPVAGQPLPEPLATRARRAWKASLPELIRDDVVDTPYQLARALRAWIAMALEQPAQRADVEGLLRVVWTAFPQASWETETLADFNRLMQHTGRSPRLQAAELPISETHLELARRTASAARETLYARYFDLPRSTPTDLSTLERLCRERARVRFSTEQPGAVTEELRLLTGDELWLLWLEFRPDLDALSLAGRTLSWIAREMGRPVHRKYQRWQQHKRIALAWRRMVFFLSLVPSDLAREWLERPPYTSQELPGSLAERLRELAGGETPPDRVPTGWCGEQTLFSS